MKKAKITKHEQHVLGILPMDMQSWYRISPRTRESLCNKGLIEKDGDGGCARIVKAKTRIIIVTPEPFELIVHRGATDDDIQSMLDERGCGTAGWKEKAN